MYIYILYYSIPNIIVIYIYTQITACDSSCEHCNPTNFSRTYQLDSIQKLRGSSDKPALTGTIL